MVGVHVGKPPTQALQADQPDQPSQTEEGTHALSYTERENEALQDGRSRKEAEGDRGDGEKMRGPRDKDEGLVRQLVERIQIPGRVDEGGEWEANRKGVEQSRGDALVDGIPKKTRCTLKIFSNTTSTKGNSLKDVDGKQRYHKLA